MKLAALSFGKDAEFSHLAARAGAQVTVLQRGPRMLPNFDPDLVGWLMPPFDGSVSTYALMPQ